MNFSNGRGASGLEINCHKCGCSLPLLHPHIMLEKTDEDENLICEQCYEEYSASQKTDRYGSSGGA
jgi:hypothetical protein